MTLKKRMQLFWTELKGFGIQIEKALSGPYAINGRLVANQPLPREMQDRLLKDDHTWVQDPYVMDNYNYIKGMLY
ncbi:MAG: hypothetical protein CL675_02740 [Bdellovibrionaceae bacterium]|nr:hypothetical protein [Pseudobdellovibrionaceae bacterium]